MSATSTARDANPRPGPSVYHLIHDLHSTVTRSIDTALSWDQLNSPPINYTLIRPIVERYSTRTKTKKNAMGGQYSSEASLGVPKAATDERAGRVVAPANEVELGSVLYALMANRIQFISLAAADLSFAALQASRAAFCELLAMKILRTFPHPENEAELAEALIHGWCAFEGAPDEVWKSTGDDRKDIEETTGSALELAIVSQAKHFLALPLIQHLINQIYLGKLIYLPVSSRSLISDVYVSDRTKKRRQGSHSSHDPATRGARAEVGNGNGKPSVPGEVFVYNPYESGWLDHQRLRVPKWRNWLECLSLTILIVLFICTLAWRDIYQTNAVEIAYVIFTFGFVLDEFAASKEHGWTVYAANAWNAFDLGYIAIFMLYLALRIFALITKSPTTSDLAFDILACGACILFPRLVFYLIKDHVVIIALRAMIARFLSFMGITFLAFSGICFCLWTLGRSTWTVKQIIWLMLQIWFGSSYLGFSASESFHPIFGPIILISYAALCNVLLITILIAILSNKFAEINGNAQEEHMFLRVVKTVEGVKSDAIFSYLPPVNLAAFLILMPLSWVCSPRTLHRINVFAVRLTNFPLLFLISAYERWSYRSKHRSIHLHGGNPGQIAENAQRPRLLDSWLAGGSEVLIASVFELQPPTTPDLGNLTSALLSSPSSDSESSHSDAKAPHSSLRPKAPKQRRQKARDSPLAKLFGKPSAMPPDRRKSGPQRKSTADQEPAPQTNGDVPEGEEVEGLKKELAEMRASQARMEEMLSKFLAGSAPDK